MTNADKFKRIFGLYATELWAKPEKDFLEWLNEDVPESDAGDTISRKAAIELIENESRKWGDEYGVSDVLCDLSDMPSAQQIVRCKDCKHKQGSCCDYSAVYVRPNGYCQWRERSEDDQRTCN